MISDEGIEMECRKFVESLRRKVEKDCESD